DVKTICVLKVSDSLCKAGSNIFPGLSIGGSDYNSVSSPEVPHPVEELYRVERSRNAEPEINPFPVDAVPRFEGTTIITRSNVKPVMVCYSTNGLVYNILGVNRV